MYKNNNLGTPTFINIFSTYYIIVMY